MKLDIILAGVGGQGVLSVSAVIAGATAGLGWHVKQSEVHGMAQRGGAVLAHLRMAEEPIHSDLIPRGRANLILSLEPMESLRYLEYLAAGGSIATDIEPVRNIGDYPELEGLLERIRATGEHRLVEATFLARQAGNAKAANMVMVGAVSDLLPVSEEQLIAEIGTRFAGLGDKVLAVNIEAFHLGVEVTRRRSASTGTTG